ncbi:MAG: fatty acid desaturase [Crocinitomicaceae bacterium]|nr:fatty acid desaturase [Crocinitomicaceae bacterium]
MENNNLIFSVLREHEVTKDRKSLAIYLFTLISFLTIIALNSFLYQFSHWLTLVLAIPSGILLCRFFVIEHDCGHNSFFTDRRHNKIAGLILGFFTLVPSRVWNHIHDAHHGKVGNLDQRKANPELWTMTVTEFINAPFLKRFGYRIFRSVIMRLLITPLIWMIIPRIPIPHLGLKIMASVMAHNIIYAVILYSILVSDNFIPFAIIYLLPVYLFNVMASIMFYLQHQFETTSWENDNNWDLYTASIHGSSYVKTGRFMGWLTGNVGCHHIHHLNTKIPCYELPIATEKVSPYVDVDVIYLKELFHHLNCVLWDEETKRLIPFSELKKRSN